MFDIGTREIIIIAVVLVLLFGSTKIPQLAKGIAEAIKTLRESFSSIDDKTSKK
jgi:sec-independent protein translocase protein TatA